MDCLNSLKVGCCNVFGYHSFQKLGVLNSDVVTAVALTALAALSYTTYILKTPVTRLLVFTVGILSIIAFTAMVFSIRSRIKLTAEHSPKPNLNLPNEKDKNIEFPKELEKKISTLEISQINFSDPCFRKPEILDELFFPNEKVCASNIKSLTETQIYELLTVFKDGNLYKFLCEVTIDQFKKMDFDTLIKNFQVNPAVFFPEDTTVGYRFLCELSQTQLNAVWLKLSTNYHALLPFEKYTLLNWDRLSLKDLSMSLINLYKTDPQYVKKLIDQVSTVQRKTIYLKLQVSITELDSTQSRILTYIRIHHKDSIVSLPETILKSAVNLLNLYFEEVEEKDYYNLYQDLGFLITEQENSIVSIQRKIKLLKTDQDYNTQLSLHKEKLEDTKKWQTSLGDYLIRSYD